ncbi:MAG: hypothetical protein LM587_03305 [Candidatus Aenigmarchaeota archaeon]|nr:hypothetical protein [Candidatus Aenigmarchaeota archaeon]
MRLLKPKTDEVIISKFIKVRIRVKDRVTDINIDVREARKLEKVLPKLHECEVFTSSYTKTDTPLVYVSCKDGEGGTVMIKIPVEHHVRLLHLHWKLHSIYTRFVVKYKLLKLKIKKLLRLAPFSKALNDP